MNEIDTENPETERELIIKTVPVTRSISGAEPALSDRDLPKKPAIIDSNEATAKNNDENEVSKNSVGID